MGLKRFVIITLLSVCSYYNLFAQDLIVTHDGDSINCRITKVKKENIYFTFKHKDEIRSTLLPVANVRNHQFGYYKTSEVPEEKVIGYEDYPHFRIAINGGFSYMTAQIAENVPVDFKDYIKDLKSGYHFGGDLSYYFTEPLGFGLKYYLFKTSNSLDNIYVENIDGTRKYGSMSDDLTISFIGPMFSSRFLNHDKSKALIMNLSVGYIDYSNDKILVDKYKMTGNTIGLSFDIGYDIGLSDNLSLGLQLSILSGTLSKYDLYDGSTTETIDLEKEEYESLNRIDFSVGLRFNK